MSLWIATFNWLTREFGKKRRRNKKENEKSRREWYRCVKNVIYMFPGKFPRLPACHAVVNACNVSPWKLASGYMCQNRPDTVSLWRIDFNGFNSRLFCNLNVDRAKGISYVGWYRILHLKYRSEWFTGISIMCELYKFLNRIDRIAISVSK